MSTSESEESAEQQPQVSPKVENNSAPWIAGVMILLTGIAQGAAPWTDHQLANIVSALLIMVAFGILLIWWRRKNRDRNLIALAPHGALVGGCILFFVLFKFQGVSGELVPKFSWRFARPRALPTESPTKSEAAITETEETFDGFLGNDRNAIVASRKFATDWSQTPPELRFRQPIGEGWSGIAIAGNFGFTMEQRDDEEWVSCYDLTSGELIWKHAELSRHENTLGGIGPRSTPALHAGRLYTHGATGIVLCFDAASGNVLWRVDLLEMLGLSKTEAETAVRWGRSGSPLIDGQNLLVPFGRSANGKGAALIALSTNSGKQVWQSSASQNENSQAIESGGGEQISYASPVIRTVAGVRQVLSTNESSVAGYDPASGRQLWSYPWPGSSSGGANCSQPMAFDDSNVLVTKAYGSGAMLLALNVTENGNVAVSESWQISSVLKTKFTNVAIHKQHGYALSDGTLECVRLTDGKRMWRQSRRSRYQQGQLLLVEDVLLVLAEDGRVALVDAKPDGFRELASIQAIEGKTWNVPSVAGRQLVVRNGNEMASYLLPKRNVQ